VVKRPDGNGSYIDDTTGVGRNGAAGSINIVQRVP